MVSFRLKSTLLGAAVAALAVALLAGNAAHANPDAWDAASQGGGSFRTLGPEFSVDVPVEPVEGARVVLLNDELARELGLTAASRADLERQILERFAVIVSQNQASPRRMFATRYQDYDSKDLKRLGNPQGDGRAVWSGEIQIKKPDGTFLYLDVSLKGVGRTPLAREEQKGWIRRRVLNRQYSDGLQGMSEAVRGFVASNAIHANGVEAVRDLAVIELPFSKFNVTQKAEEKAAITVRVGGQTRAAHLRYHAGNKENIRKLFPYIVRRDLGLPLDAPLKAEDVRRYFEKFTDALADQAAHYFDSAYLHGSLTAGNQTTRGAPIDFGTFLAGDANHGRFRYLSGTSLWSEQASDIKAYISQMLGYLDEGMLYRHGGGELFELSKKSLRERFDARLSAVSGDLWFARLGLSPADINEMPLELRNQIVIAMRDVHNALGRNLTKINGQDLVPQAFDFREIVRNSLRIQQLPEAERDTAWKKLFLTERSWGTLREADLLRPPGTVDKFLRSHVKGTENFPVVDYSQIFRDYRAAMQVLGGYLKEKGIPLATVIDRANAAGGRRRPEPWLAPNLAEILREIQSGGDSAKVTELARATIREISDRPDLAGVAREDRRFSFSGCFGSYTRIRRPPPAAAPPAADEMVW